MKAHVLLAVVALTGLVSAVGCDDETTGPTGGSGGQTSTGTAGSGGVAASGGTGGSTTTGTGVGGAGGHGGVGVGGAAVAGGGTGGSGGTLPSCDVSGPQDCSPGPGQGTADQCWDIPAHFGDEVNAAIDGVIQNHPAWFDTSQGAACCPLVLEYDLYVQQVAADLAAYGLCAIQDPNAGDEMPVKRNNECAEQYDILTSQGFVRRPPGGFNGTCIPAWF